MAYFSITTNSVQQYLSTTSSSSAVAFSTTSNTNNQVTVAFYTTASDGTVSATPSTYLCNGKSYVLRIYASNGVNGFLGMPSQSQSTYAVVSPSSPQTSTALSLFSPSITTTPTDIRFTTPFSATLNGASSVVILTHSPFYTNVGYNTVLPNLLNDCVNCPCPSGTTCSNSVCVATTPCNGTCGGQCNGTCQTGYTCTSSGGSYVCVADPPAKSQTWYWVVGIIVALVLILIIIVIIYSVFRRPTTTTTTFQTAPPTIQYSSSGPPVQYSSY